MGFGRNLPDKDREGNKKLTEAQNQSRKQKSFGWNWALKII